MDERKRPGRKPRPEARYVQVQTRMPRELYERIERARGTMQRSAWVREAIEMRLGKEDDDGR